jgi:hypothetical protein
VLPDPDGFEFVRMPRDEWRKVVDPDWTPRDEECKYLGRYVRHTYRERDQRAQVLMRLRADTTADELQFMLELYFRDPKAAEIFGDVRVLGIDHSERDVFVARISTDLRDVRYFTKR